MSRVRAVAREPRLPAQPVNAHPHDLERTRTAARQHKHDLLRLLRRELRDLGLPRNSA
jgi:hypothetical protein